MDGYPSWIISGWFNPPQKNSIRKVEAGRFNWKNWSKQLLTCSLKRDHFKRKKKSKQTRKRTFWTLESIEIRKITWTKPPPLWGSAMLIFEGCSLPNQPFFQEPLPLPTVFVWLAVSYPRGRTTETRKNNNYSDYWICHEKNHQKDANKHQWSLS